MPKKQYIRTIETTRKIRDDRAKRMEDARGTNCFLSGAGTKDREELSVLLSEVSIMPFMVKNLALLLKE